MRVHGYGIHHLCSFSERESASVLDNGDFSGSLWWSFYLQPLHKTHNGIPLKAYRRLVQTFLLLFGHNIANLNLV